MFGNSRPRPSPQTIELVRQFAYITSGALCGVTALYLEECRRRIQIVQRVLDKRRAIVQAAQSRQYSRAALAGRFDDADSEEIQFPGPRLQHWSGVNAGDYVPYLPPAQQSEPSRKPTEHDRAELSRVVEDQTNQLISKDGRVNGRASPIRHKRAPAAFLRQAIPKESRQSDKEPRSTTRVLELQKADKFAAYSRRARKKDPIGRVHKVSRPDGNTGTLSEKAQHFNENQAIDKKSNDIIPTHSLPGIRKTRAHREVMANYEGPEASRMVQSAPSFTAAEQQDAGNVVKKEEPLDIAESLGNVHDRSLHVDLQHATQELYTPPEEVATASAANLVDDQDSQATNALPNGYINWLPEQLHGYQPFHQPPAKRRRTMQSEDTGAEVSLPPKGLLGEDTTKSEAHERRQRLKSAPIPTLTLRERKASATATNKRLHDQLVRTVQTGFDLQSSPSKVRKHDRSEPITELTHQREQPSEGSPLLAAEALLPATLREGSLHDVISLCQRMLNVKLFRPEHGRDLIDAAPRLAGAYDPEKTFDFCATLLDNLDYAAMDPEEIFRQKVRLSIHSFDWDLPQGARSVGKRLFNRQRLLTDPKSKARTLHTECERLILNNQAPRATHVFLLAQRSWPKSDGRRFTDLLPVTNMIMESIVKVEDLECLKWMLLWSQWFQKPEDLKERFNQLVEITWHHKSYEALASVLVQTRQEKSHWLTQWTFRTWMELADGINKAILNITCSVDPRLRSAFEDLYRQVPEEHRHYVNEHASIETLRATWKITRNLESVESEAVRLSNRLKDREDEAALSKLNNTLLEIYLNHGKYDRALDCIANINQKRRSDVEFLTLAALYFARSWKWGGLEHLLGLSKQHAPFAFDDRSTTLFNDIIRFYIQDHTPIECWMFVSSAIDELGFIPNLATVKMILGKFVQDKELDLIPRWLRFISGVRPDLDLTGAQGSLMIRKYYFWNRQPSDVLFQLCHRLTASVPFFTAYHFKTTLKVAIGHDLRFGSIGDDASTIQHAALARLESLKTAVDVVPHPNDFDQANDEAPALDLESYSSAGEAETDESGNEQHYHDLIARFNDEVNTAEQEANDEYNAPKDPEEQFDDLVPKSKNNFSPDDDNIDSAIGEEHIVEDEREESLSRGQEFNLGMQEDGEQTPVDEGIDLTDDFPDASLSDDNALPAREQLSSRGQQERTAEMLRVREIEEDMALALALDRYQQALNLYRDSCDATGLPASGRTLRHAIDASIRLHDGDTSAAEQMIAEAKTAGMDVHRAMDPLLIHRSSRLTVGDAKDARRICDATIDYYAENFKNGYNLRYALAHTVANVLTNRGHAQEALRLLATIFQSGYAARKMSSIKTMSVWLKAYAQLLSVEGLEWVVKIVLTQNLSIDMIFLMDLERVSRHPFHEADQKRMRGWLRMCQDRRRDQDLEAKVFGHQLVDCLIEYSQKYRPARGEKRLQSPKTVMRKVQLTH